MGTSAAMVTAVIYDTRAKTLNVVSESTLNEL